ncbi:MAG: hypothetical protein LBH58_14620 [Tannerellaceae bacterium]|nr:hypothetical protein [Tannerellaceae bacterium]
MDYTNFSGKNESLLPQSNSIDRAMIPSNKAQQKLLLGRCIKMRKKSLPIWLVLILVAFMIMSGGCGGSSSQTENPTASLTTEDIDNGREIVDTVTNSVFNGEQELDFDEFIEKTVASLKADEAVENVTYIKEADEFDSSIKVDFKSGFSETIQFIDENSVELWEGNILNGENILPLENAVKRSSGAHGAGLINAIGIQYLAIKGEGKVPPASEDIRIVEHAFAWGKVNHGDKANFYTFSSQRFHRDSLEILRSLSNYDLIMIQAHGYGGGKGFAISLHPSATLSAFDVSDIENGRVAYIKNFEIFNTVVVSNITSKIRNKHTDALLVMPGFFADYYMPGGLRSPIVVLFSCGLATAGNDVIPQALILGGARAVIGANEDIFLLYELMASSHIINNLMNGETVAQALSNTKKIVGNNDHEIDTYFKVIGDENPGASASELEEYKNIFKQNVLERKKRAASLVIVGDPNATLFNSPENSWAGGSGNWVGISGSGNGIFGGYPFTATMNHFETHMEFVMNIGEITLVKFGPASYSFTATSGGRSELFEFNSNGYTVPVTKLSDNKYMWNTSEETITITFTSDTDAVIDGIYYGGGESFNFKLNVRQQ